ncbi:Uncharacterized protein Fot_09576 [Forsythia ovata]|uniref:Uncharacterized protein n=1 Tax=Forsythia ovata TaxID=205694 RepID=A0ABD1WES5_9LAMI
MVGVPTRHQVNEKRSSTLPETHAQRLICASKSAVRRSPRADRAHARWISTQIRRAPDLPLPISSAAVQSAPPVFGVWTFHVTNEGHSCASMAARMGSTQMAAFQSYSNSNITSGK